MHAAFWAVSVLVPLLITVPVTAKCPWDANLTTLHAGCSCALNLGQQLTVHCSLVNLTELVTALRTAPPATVVPNNNETASTTPTIALLYLTNASIGTLGNGTFLGLRVVSLQLVQCGVTSVQPDAFVGLNETLTTLGLTNNALKAIPSESLQRLSNLVSLDLSRNQIPEMPESSFTGVHLHVLKMGGNRPLLVHPKAFAGLETTLRNLNLQDTGQTRVPDALANLSALALLDLGQNMLVGVDEGALDNLKALTALNLERNPIGSLSAGALVGVKDTLSSLSLLSNVLVQFPTEALRPLKHLRVLDLGFNQIASVPNDAFQGMGALTLLALDGNPISTLHPAAFGHLNHSLRGLSIGGKSLECDCRLRWVSEWIRDYDLQVTSRERNPHFCGKPSHLNNSNLMQLQPDQLRCPDEPNTTTSTTSTTTTEASTVSDVAVIATSTAVASVETEKTTAAPEEAIGPLFVPPTLSAAINGTTRNEASLPRGLRTDFDITSESPPPIAVARIAVEDSTVHVEWEASGSESGSVRVAYRLFGEDQFKVSRSLSPFDRQLAISNVPDNECLIVCLLHTSDEDNLVPLTLTTETLPAASCREVRTRRTEGNDADKVVIIAASAAICAAILIAVVIFVCCNRQRLRKEERQMPMPASLAPLPVMDVYKPTAAVAADWDTASVYSTRSIPRAQMYHVENAGGTVNSSFLIDDHLIHLPPPPAGKVLGRRPYSAMGSTSGRLNHYPMGRPENSRSSHSLAVPAHSTMTGGALYKKRTRHKRATMSSAGPFHSLRGFDPEDNPHLFKNDRWTDQELESYAVIKGHPSHMPLNHGFP